jgi:hypothetical protein
MRRRKSFEAAVLVRALAFPTLNPVFGNLPYLSLLHSSDLASDLPYLIISVLFWRLGLDGCLRALAARGCAAGGSARRRSRARLLHFSPKFISRASRSECAGRYVRGTRAQVPDFLRVDETDSGRLAPSPGALPFARARPARSARSSHTPCPPVPPATPPRSTRTCAQDGLGLEEEVRRHSEPAGGRARLESRGWRVHPPRRAPCAPARAAAGVTRPLGIAVGRACEGGGREERVRMLERVYVYG